MNAPICYSKNHASTKACGQHPRTCPMLHRTNYSMNEMHRVGFISFTNKPCPPLRSTINRTGEQNLQTDQHLQVSRQPRAPPGAYAFISVERHLCTPIWCDLRCCRDILPEVALVQFDMFLHWCCGGRFHRDPSKGLAHLLHCW